MPIPEGDDVRFDLRFSGHKSYVRPAAAAVASIAVLFIILTMNTNIAAYLLPMSDEYLQVMVPRAPDGDEPLSLTMLEHEVSGDTITVSGAVSNRTEFPISGILAVIEVRETTGRFPTTLEVPVEPAEVESQASATFLATATLRERPASYSVKFRLDEGPFVPHKDERTSTFGVVGG